MKIIYDMNEENPALKCYAEDNEGNRLCYFGCYKILIEETNKKTGQPLGQREIKRWGNAKERMAIHKKINDFI